MRTKTPLQAEKMLEAAAALFGTQRFHEVRMEDIATAAGVGKGTIYRYFSDKEDLYLALLERASKQMHERLTRSVGNRPRPREDAEVWPAGVCRVEAKVARASAETIHDGAPRGPSCSAVVHHIP